MATSHLVKRVKHPNRTRLARLRNIFVSYILALNLRFSFTSLLSFVDSERWLHQCAFKTRIYGRETFYRQHSEKKKGYIGNHFTEHWVIKIVRRIWEKFSICLSDLVSGKSFQYKLYFYPHFDTFHAVNHPYEISRRILKVSRHPQILGSSMKVSDRWIYKLKKLAVTVNKANTHKSRARLTDFEWLRMT